MRKSDYEMICAAEYIPWERLRGKRLLITGATGLIGASLISALLCANKERDLRLSVLALVRDEARARARFAAFPVDGAPLRFLVGDAKAPPGVDGPVDFIVHGASLTAGRAFVRCPVETIETAVLGTLAMLSLARQKGSEGFVYLSSMEVYGYPPKGRKVLETDACALKAQEARNSYPISKLQSENLCCAYAHEYGVPAVIARLAQTFGPDTHPEDNRIFAEFAGCVRDRRDIVLRTRGETERSYLYAADAVTGLLTLLLRGQPGQAYNVADERAYASIAEMAQRIAKAAGIGVRFEIDEKNARGYNAPVYMDMDTSRIRALGWRAQAGGAVGEDHLDAYARLMCRLADTKGRDADV